MQMIRLADLHKPFKNMVVHDVVSLDVEAGEILTVIGGSGTGKSILLKQIVGLIKPNSGEIWIEGREITKLNEEELHEVQKKMGYVFQESALFDSMTVGDNVAFGYLNLYKA